MPKLKARTVAKSVARRLVHPKHLVRAVKLQRGRKVLSRSLEDPELALFARILPTGFLHYGYFDDPDRQPLEMSLCEVHRAQHRYAELLLEHAHDRSSPVLDVGCGMGGLVKMLLERGFLPVALTPDRTQAEHVRRTYPGVPVIQSKFEMMLEKDSSGVDHTGRYGTVFTSESLQYLKLDKALPLLERVLKPGGTWIACDFFRTGVNGDKAGHDWDGFHRQLDQAGWEIAFERDITRHMLPTLRYIHMWASQFGLPLMDFAQLKLRQKQPGLHYVLEDVLSMLQKVVDENLQIIDPAAFEANKKYALMVMRRRA